MITYRIRPSVKGVEGKVKCEYKGHGGQRTEQWWAMVSKGDRKKLEYDTVEEMTEHINEFEANKKREYEIKIVTVADEASEKPAKATKAAKAPKVKKPAKKAAKAGVKLPTSKRSKKIAAPEAEDKESTDLAEQVAAALAEESKVA